MHEAQFPVKMQQVTSAVIGFVAIIAFSILAEVLWNLAGTVATMWLDIAACLGQ